MCTFDPLEENLKDGKTYILNVALPLVCRQVHSEVQQVLNENIFHLSANLNIISSLRKDGLRIVQSLGVDKKSPAKVHIDLTVSLAEANTTESAIMYLQDLEHFILELNILLAHIPGMAQTSTILTAFLPEHSDSLRSGILGSVGKLRNLKSAKFSGINKKISKTLSALMMSSGLYEDLLEFTLRQKESGNAKYRATQFQLADEWYRMAFNTSKNLLNKATTEDTKEQARQVQNDIILNLTRVQVNLGRCTESVEISTHFRQDGSVKTAKWAYWRARAFMGLKDNRTAVSLLESARQICPADTGILTVLEKARRLRERKNLSS
jgi:hypothetical protein